jgi:hypothetical protein
MHIASMQFETCTFQGFNVVPHCASSRYTHNHSLRIRVSCWRNLLQGGHCRSEEGNITELKTQITELKRQISIQWKCSQQIGLVSERFQMNWTTSPWTAFVHIRNTVQETEYSHCSNLIGKTKMFHITEVRIINFKKRNIRTVAQKTRTRCLSAWSIYLYNINTYIYVQSLPPRQWNPNLKP